MKVKTTPWMRYEFLSGNFVAYYSCKDDWAVCRGLLKRLFELPTLPRNNYDKTRLQIQLVAYTTPGPDRVKVEKSCSKSLREPIRITCSSDRAGGLNFFNVSAAFIHVVIDGTRREVFPVLREVVYKLLKKRKAIYVECFYK